MSILWHTWPMLLLHLASSDTPFQYNLDFVNSPFFVDKSLLMVSFFEERSGRYNFASFPRRFGKSTNIQMLKTFLNYEVDSQGRTKTYADSSAYHIFKNLKIFQNKEFVKRHFARHPVILVDLKYTKEDAPTESSVIPWLNSRIQQSFVEYAWILDKIKSNPDSWAFTIKEREVQIFEQALHADLNVTQIPECLGVLTKVLFNYFRNSKAIVLVDHYDSFQLNVDRLSQVLVEQAYGYINNMLLHPFKTFYHYFGYGFGVTTTAQRLPINPAEGRLRNYVFLDDHNFISHFGFTIEDMESLYRRHNCSPEEKRRIKKWYNGYSAWIRCKSIYQPYSVINYMENRHQPNALRVYWPKSIPSAMILPFFKVPEFREKIIQLVTFRESQIFIRKSRFEPRLLPNFTSFSLRYDQSIQTVQLHEIYLYFFENGYLSHTSKQTDFRIPNMEVRQYLNKVLTHLYVTKGIPIYGLRDLMMKSLQAVDNDPEGLQEEIRQTFESAFQLIRMPKFRTMIRFEYYAILHISALEIKSVMPQVRVNFKPIEGHRGDVLLIENDKVLTINLQCVRTSDMEKELPSTLNYSLPFRGINRVIYIQITIGDYGDVKVSMRDYSSDNLQQEYQNIWEAQPDQEDRYGQQQQQQLVPENQDETTDDTIRFSEEQHTVQQRRDESQDSRFPNKEANSLYSLPEID